MLNVLILLPLLAQAGFSLTIDVRQAGGVGAPTPVSFPPSSPAQGGVGPPTPVSFPGALSPAGGASSSSSPASSSVPSSSMLPSSSTPPISSLLGSSTPPVSSLPPSSSAPPVSSMVPSSSHPPISSSGYTPPTPPAPPTPPSPPAPPTPPTPPAPPANEQDDGYPYPSVKFTSNWPAEFKTGETVHMEWTGGSGRYDVWWLESWKDEYDCYTQQYYFLRNESYTSYDFYFSPAGCWKRDASFLFGVQEGDVQAGSVTQRDHDTGPLKYLIRGADDDYNDC